MKVYQTCGSFDVASLTATANTYLPNDKTLSCKYIKYYNISNSTEFGVFGVMTDNQGNKDLRSTTLEVIATQVNPQPIDLINISSVYATRKLDTLTIKNSLYFFCFHDDAFDESYLLNLQQSKISLKALLVALNNSDFEQEGYVIPPKLIPFVPKKGNGGILTANGSC